MFPRVYSAPSYGFNFKDNVTFFTRGSGVTRLKITNSESTLITTRVTLTY